MTTMKIRRYFFPMYSGVPDDPNGDWVKYEDVKPLLERIKELEDEVKKLEKQLEFERCVTYYSLEGKK